MYRWQVQGLEHSLVVQNSVTNDVARQSHLMSGRGQPQLRCRRPLEDPEFSATLWDRCGGRGDEADQIHRLCSLQCQVDGRKKPRWCSSLDAKFGTFLLTVNEYPTTHTTVMSDDEAPTLVPAEAQERASKPLGMRKNGMLCSSAITCEAERLWTLTPARSGKQWHEQKKAFRPSKGLTTFEKRAKERAAMAQMKAKEKEMKEEKEAMRKVRTQRR